MTGLKVIDGTPSEISRELREREMTPPKIQDVCDCGHTKVEHDNLWRSENECRCSICDCKKFTTKIQDVQEEIKATMIHKLVQIDYEWLLRRLKELETLAFEAGQKSRKKDISEEEFDYQQGVKETLKEVKEMIEGEILKQRKEYERCKELRPTRMKNNNSNNWGMVDAENRILHYEELLQKIEEKK